FSSRRRHTSFSRDWSSDVCSSDLAVIAVPSACFIDNARLHAQIDDFALARDAGAVHDVEFGLLERRRDFVFNHLDAGLVTDNFVALFDGADAPDVETD